MNAIVKSEPQPPSLIATMADRYGMAPTIFEKTIRATCLPNPNVSNEQFAAFLMVANEYKLNPVLREIFAFPGKGGGIQPIVSIDGWSRLINERPEMNGMEFKDELGEDGQLIAITCRIYRKDRAHPTEVTEYMSECRRNTDTWRQWPARMLRHKAMIQAARYAFGFSGISDPDEYERSIAPAKPIEAKRLHADFPETALAPDVVEGEFVDAETGEVTGGPVPPDEAANPASEPESGPAVAVEADPPSPEPQDADPWADWDAEAWVAGQKDAADTFKSKTKQDLRDWWSQVSGDESWATLVKRHADLAADLKAHVMAIDKGLK